MEAARSSYPYQPLTEPHSIRLLILQPNPDHEADLYGSLLHSTLEECDEDLVESYTALSYVWGDASQIATVHLAGRAVKITATLGAALRDMRDETRPRRIWADALCIDQSNIPERNAQVTLMALIYRVAHHTVVYLGQESEDTKTLMTSARRFLSMRPKTPVDEADAGIRQCGRRRLRWTDLCDTLGLNADDGLFVLDKELHILDDMNRARLKPMKMVKVLEARRSMGATDARDFIFAHIGVASDRDEISALLPVDYSLPLHQVFSRFSRYILESESVRTLLLLVDQELRVDRKPNLPSWVVDWRLPASSRRGVEDDWLFEYNMGRLLAEDTPPKDLMLQHGDAIGLFGYSIGTLTAVSCTIAPDAGTYRDDIHDCWAGIGEHSRYHWLPGYQTSPSGSQLYTRPHPDYGFSDQAREAAYMQVCLDLLSKWPKYLRGLVSLHMQVPHQHEVFVEFFSSFSPGNVSRQIHEFFSTTGTPRESKVLALVSEHPQPDRYSDPIQDSRSLYDKRIAFICGSRLAVVPPRAQAGDIVVHIPGSRMLVVLRSHPVTAKDLVAVEAGFKEQFSTLAHNNDLEQWLKANVQIERGSWRLRHQRHSPSREPPHLEHMNNIRWPDNPSFGHYEFMGICEADDAVPEEVNTSSRDMGVFVLH
ncbi:hypothetical protein DL546_009005 [Coniochaeta pulveracea]|uniref:Heterokaryon incompatibility domain-containing protein n=1 Tax=Coniochaeta pulveracea TaxID=177199 RepID=A0A420YGR9_9PEZI|nr:hypothetical protein DL546_009005 [Coniochaeta pulveracea]